MIAQSAAAHAAYSRPEAPVRNFRALEYDLLARATKALTTARSDANGFAKLVAALRRKPAPVVDLGRRCGRTGKRPSPENCALSFSIFTNSPQNTARAVRDKGASVEVLIDINTAVMRGLRGQGAAP